MYFLKSTVLTSAIIRRVTSNNHPTGADLMRCPSCLSDMQGHQVNGTLVEQCDRCPAIWVDAEKIEALRLAQSPGSNTPPERFLESNTEAGLRCTSCGTGRLQSGSIGSRPLMVCTRCKGIFITLTSETNHPELWRSIVAEILWFFGWTP